MGDINLLPDELRDKEEKELKSVRKKPKTFEVKMTSPAPDKSDLPIKESKPSIMSRLFSRKVEEGKPIEQDRPEGKVKDFNIKPEREERQVVNIPKFKKGRGMSFEPPKYFGSSGSDKPVVADSSGDIREKVEREDEKDVKVTTDQVVKIKEKKPKKSFNPFGWLTSLFSGRPKKTRVNMETGRIVYQDSSKQKEEKHFNFPGFPEKSVKVKEDIDKVKLDKEERQKEKEIIQFKSEKPKTKKKFQFNFFSWLASLFSFKRKDKIKFKAVKTEIEPKDFSDKKQEKTLEMPEKVEIKEDRSGEIEVEEQKEIEPKIEKIEEVKVEEKKNDNEQADDESEEEEKSLGINLIPKDFVKDRDFEFSKKVLTFGLTVFIFALVVGVSYLGITWYQLKVERQLQELRKEVSIINGQIEEYEKYKLAALNLQEKLEAVKGLLDRHIYWTRFFEMLEENTAKDVFYTNFAMVGTDKLSITAVGRDYQSVAEQLIAFQQARDFVSSVEINSAAAKIDEEGFYQNVTFDVNLEFLPNVFLKPIE